MNEPSKLNNFISCKNDSLNIKSYVLNNSSDSDSINSAIDRLILKNKACISMGEEAVKEIKGNYFESSLNKAIDLSIQRITAENNLYLMIQKDIKTNTKLKSDSVQTDLLISRLFRTPEIKTWNELTIQIKQRESKTETKGFFDFTTIMVIAGLIFWAWVAGKKRQEDRNADSNDSKVLKKMLEDYKNKKD